MRPDHIVPRLARRIQGVLFLAAVYGCDAAANPLGPNGISEPAPQGIVVSPGADTLTALGSALQLQAHLRGADEPVPVEWRSSDTSIVVVDSVGEVVSVGNGRAVVHAEAHGQRDSAVVVVEQVVVALAAELSERTLAPGESMRPEVYAVDANGAEIASARVQWTSLDPAVATADSAGTLRGIKAGVARFVARVGALADTMALPVLGTSDLLVTAGASDALWTEVRPGQTVDVPVILDLSRLGDDGDLGSIQLEVAYDPALLHPESSNPGVDGAAVTNLDEPGRVRFAFVATAVQSVSRLTLVTLTFRVADQAPAGAVADLGITYTGKPTDTSFVPYAVPVTLTGAIRVAGK